jgi:class 3 adenylate cyclase
VGVHSGSAISQDGDWYGRAVNVASRLCSVAAGGEVLVSESTLAAASEMPRVSVGERRLHWLKNVTEPVAARATELNRRTQGISRFRARHCPFGIRHQADHTMGSAA